MHGVLFAVNVAFASLSVAGKAATSVVTPEVVSLVRVAGAAGFFALLQLALRGVPRLPRRDLAIVAAASAGIALASRPAAAKEEEAA